jgi:nicotinamide riboside kinase
MPLKKIVIIGPESTGKSTLCEGLAAHYHTEWVREYAREYMLAHMGKDYNYDDLTTIARGQLALEDTAVAAGEREAATGDSVLHRYRSLCHESMERICFWPV